MGQTYKCYVIGKLDAEFRICAVSTCSEPPWSMTKRLAGRWVILFVAWSNESYGNAAEQAREVYPEFMPSVAKKFPLS